MSSAKITLIGLAFIFITTGAGLAGESTPESGSFIFLETSSSCTDEPAAIVVAQATEPTESPSSGETQERAVPRMAPGTTPGTAPPTRFKGGVVQGNRLQADPGYVVESLPGNRVALKPAGGGAGIEANCMCQRKGGCSFEVVGPSAYCGKSKTNSCTMNCILTVGGKLSGGVMSIQ
ncbi:MAG: hypothetical protein ACXWV7_09860 [Nitrospira sp.]